MENTNEQKPNYQEVAKANRELVRRLAEIHCSLAEISHITGIKEGTLEKKYKKELDIGKANGKMGLRRTQMDKAMEGDARMLVWLGKQLLSQSDNPQGGDDSKPLPWNDEDL
jgi:hypothetical protein